MMSSRSAARTRSSPCGARRAHDRDWPERLADARRCPGTRHRGQNRRCRAAPWAAAARGGRGPGPPRQAQFPAGTCPRRSRPGRAAARPASLGSTSRRDACRGRQDDRPSRPCRSNSATRAASSRGCATQAARRPHQRAAERRREREPAKRPRLPVRCRARSPTRRRAAAMQRNACHSTRRTEREPGGNAAAEADHDPRRKLRALGLEELLQPLAQRRKTALFQ